MSAPARNKTINIQYILITLVAVAVSWVLHEWAHWATGTLLGYEMGMTFNKTFPVSGEYNSEWHSQIVSAAGPVFTLFEALVVFFILQKKKIVALYPFLFTCFYMRSLAALMSILNPNDEARISGSAGLGVYTLPVIMVAILSFLVYKTSSKYQFSRKFNLLTLVLVIFFSSIIILTDQFFQVRLL